MKIIISLTTALCLVFLNTQNGKFVISAMRGGFPISKSFDEFTPAEKEKYLADKKLTKQFESGLLLKGEMNNGKFES